MLPFAPSQSRCSMLKSNPTTACRPRSACTWLYQSSINLSSATMVSARDILTAHESTRGFGISLAAAPERHACRSRSLIGVVPEVDAALGEIVRRELERHLVAGQDADPVPLHLPRHVRHDLVAVRKRDAKPSVGKLVGDDAFHLDQCFLGHQMAFRSMAERLPSSSLRTS